MTALDFMMACVGVGVLLISSAHAFRILSDTRSRNKQAHKDLLQRRDEPLDPMGRQLHDLRSARFGRPMAPPMGTEMAPKPTVSTWPVMRPKQAAPPPEKKAPTKDKERGEK